MTDRRRGGVDAEVIPGCAALADDDQHSLHDTKSLPLYLCVPRDDRLDETAPQMQRSSFEVVAK